MVLLSHVYTDAILVWSLPVSTVIDQGQRVSAPLDSGTQWIKQTKWEAIDYICPHTAVVYMNLYAESHVR